MNYFCTIFFCVCFVCVLFIALCYFCLYVVLFLLLSIWLLTRHVDRQELNWIVTVIRSRSIIRACSVGPVGMDGKFIHSCIQRNVKEERLGKPKRKWEITLQYILKTQYMNLWTAFTWLSTVSCGPLLCQWKFNLPGLTNFVCFLGPWCHVFERNTRIFLFCMVMTMVCRI